MAIQQFLEDTIVAPITAPGQAAVSVLRVSGPLVRTVIEHLCSAPSRVLNAPHTLILSKVFNRLSLEDESLPLVMDMALVAYFPAGASFTGEDSVEFHLHGSPFLLSRLLQNVLSLGARQAEPGEFTKRAYLNGRLDLVQAEAIADLVSAETEAQAQAASDQLQGKLSQAITELGEPLRNLLAELEALLDFPEEEIETLTLEQFSAILDRVLSSLTQFVESFHTGRLCREGASVVIAGAPNAGKSSLLNRLLGEDRVIVTASPGTTRDSIEERISLRGLLVRVWDTAGLVLGEHHAERELGEAERLGIERSWSRIQNADLALYLVDFRADFVDESVLFKQVCQCAKRTLFVINKLDLAKACDVPALIESAKSIFGKTPVFISALNGDGLAELRELVLEHLAPRVLPSSSLLVTNQRHEEALKSARDLLLRARENLAGRLPLELVAVDLRAALGALDEIIGTTTAEDILGRIFSRFCIGK